MRKRERDASRKHGSLANAFGPNRTIRYFLASSTLTDANVNSISSWNARNWFNGELRKYDGTAFPLGLNCKFWDID